MRPIKFRAWDKVAKKFLMPWPEGFHIIGEVTCFDLIGQQLHERNPKSSVLEMLDDVEITQWTGLHDKNCKEIWEGDILKYKPFEMLVTVVEFFEGGFWMMNYPKDGHGVPVGSFKESREVLGNIYENPELLK